MRALALFVLLLMACGTLRAMAPTEADSLAMWLQDAQGPELAIGALRPDEHVRENHRAVAITLAVLLGPFGAHRLYLGTTPKVAIAYGLTFGGFGVVALIDLVHLIVTKDLDRFRNNDRILMWAEEPTPP